MFFILQLYNPSNCTVKKKPPDVQRLEKIFPDVGRLVNLRFKEIILLYYKDYFKTGVQRLVNHFADVGRLKTLD